MATRLGDTQSYWDNYRGFQKNIGDLLESDLKDVSRKVRFGTLSDLAGTNKEAALRADAGAQLDALKQGPTYQLLTDEFTAQRDFAQAQYDSTGPYAGQDIRYREATRSEPGGPVEGEAGYYSMREQGGEVGGLEATYLGATDPRAGRTPFTFAASLEDFFGGQYPDVATEEEAAGAVAQRASRSTSGTSGGRPRGTGGGGGQVVGLDTTEDEVYTWY